MEGAPDSTGLGVEIGFSSDYTNEVYYLDALVDTTFLRRERFATPQARFAGVLATRLAGSRGGGATNFTLLNELSLGNRLRRDAAFGTWRSEIGPDWRLVVTPRFEYRWDQTLDRDFVEYSAGTTARVRRSWPDGATGTEFGLQGEWLRTSGLGAEILPGRHGGAVLVAVDHGGLGSADWRLDYTFRARAFPDSQSRDHFEHSTEARARWTWGPGHSLVLEGGTIRRVTIRTAPTSLDNFWEERFASEAQYVVDERWTLPVRAELEAQQYDLQDSLSYFNYEITRFQTGLRARPSLWWTITAGPRAEFLFARLNPGEAYREVAGYVDLDVVGERTLWSLVPSAGWRHYTFRGGPVTEAVSQHSAYGFLELECIADQPVGRSWRVRVAGTGRTEFHTESIEDAASLYFSLDVRRLF